MTDTGPDPDTLPEPANLRFLRLMVTILTATMIAGVVIVVTLLVIRLNGDQLVMPDSIALPDGHRALSFTQAPDWYAVVTDQDMILIYDRLTGDLIQQVSVQGN